MAKKKNVDFQKVKFKVGRSLKKNTNVTDTSFKTKKIFIKETEKPKTELATHHKLNVTELLIRLRHHNSSVRIEAFTGLKELLSDYPEIIIASLSVLVEKITETIVDKDDVMRKLTLKTLEVIFKHCTPDRIAPFFSTLKSYLNCTATHIISSIQDDSLNFLDLLLKYFPSLTTRTCSKVLENIIEISMKNISKAMTKRKIAILLKLEAFLEATLTSENDSISERNFLHSNKSIESNCNPFYRNGGLNSPIKDQFNIHPNLTVFPETESIIGNQVYGINFLTIVKNFLLEFLNDCKSSSLLLSPDKQNKVITLQVMQSVLNVLILLQTCANCSDTKNGTKKMIKSYNKLFQSNDLMKFISLFPFNMRNELSDITKDKENQYVYFNLCVCDAFIGIYPEITTQTKKYYENVTKYIIKSLTNNEISGKKLTLKTMVVVKNLNNSNIDKELLEELLLMLYNTYTQWKLGRKDREEIMKYFVELSVQTNSYFTNSMIFQNWMKSILKEFCDTVHENLSMSTIHCMSKTANTLALRGLPLFLEELQKSYNSVLDTFTAVCERFPEGIELHCHIVELLSFIPKFTREIFIQLINSFMKPCISVKSILHLIELLHVRILKTSSNTDIGLYISFLLDVIVGILKKDVINLFEKYTKDKKWLQIRNILPLLESSFIIIPSDKNVFDRHMNLVEKICDMILLCNVENLPHYIQNFIQAILAQYPCFPTYSAVSILILQTKLSKIFVGTADYQNSLINLSLSIIFYSIAAINSEHYSGTEDGSVLRIVCQFLKTLNFSSKVCNIIWNSVKVMHIQQTAVLGSVFSLLLKCNLFGMEEIVVVNNILLELKMKFPQIINKKWWMELNYYVQLFKGPTAMLVKS